MNYIDDKLNKMESKIFDSEARMLETFITCCENWGIYGLHNTLLVENNKLEASEFLFFLFSPTFFR